MNISVIIPLYNKRDSILRAINSVFAQTFKPVEIIIVNDGSTDGSEKLVTELNHPLVHLIHQKNGGVSAARNKGIVKAHGDWIAFLDADDEWKPEYLENIYFLHHSYPNANVLATAYELQDYIGNRKPITLKKILFTGQHGILNNYFEVASFSHPPIWTSAVVVKKDALYAIGFFPLGIKSGEDLLTWARLAARYEIGYSLKALSIFIQIAAHTHDDLPNRVPEIPDIVGYELTLLLKKNGKALKIKKYISHWHRMRSSIFFRLGKRQYSIQESIKALMYNIQNYHVYAYLFLSFLPKRIVRLILRKNIKS